MLKIDKQLKDALNKQEQAKKDLDSALKLRNDYIIKLLNDMPLSSMLNVDTPTLVGSIKTTIDLINKPDKNDEDKLILENQLKTGEKFCKQTSRQKNVKANK